MMPFEMFGDAGEVVLFAHANAYPPRTYRRFIEALTGRFRVLAISQRPLWPGSRPEEIDGWDDLAQDLLAFMRARNIRDVLAVGHSLGAVALTLAAAAEGDRFRTLALVEPVFLPAATISLARLAPRSMNPLVRVALNRRHEWPSREEAFAHFRPKEVFARWPDESLRDFVDHGLRENSDNGTVTLAYSRDWEAHIYATVPHVWKILPTVTRPVLGIRGEHSDTLNDASWRRWQKLQPAAEFVEMAGVGHMVPMEAPAGLAAHVRAFFERQAGGEENNT